MSVIKKIKVLIVDDSALFRSLISLALKDCDNIEVVGTAPNGKIGIEKALNTDADLMILDLEMPVMDGIETVKEMTQRKLKPKVILFSSMSRLGAEKTLAALDLGALDFVAKPVGGGSQVSVDQKIRLSLLPIIHSLFLPSRKPSKLVATANYSSNKKLIRPDVLVIASSTGGPNALTEFFQQLTDPLPFPILITQHMPPLFTASLAQRLGTISRRISAEGIHGEVLQANHIYVAPGDYHMSISGSRHKPLINLDQGPARNFVKPCADFLFETAAEIYGENTLAVVLTGMGRDGGDGSAVIKSAGGTVLIQDQMSSVVFGMPGAVYEEGNYDFIAKPADLAKKVLLLSRNKGATNVA